jgi:hypothetical protein
MASKIRVRRDTSINWSVVNPILALGEPGLETDTGKIKYGDGVTAWVGREYASKGDAGVKGDKGDMSTVVGLTATSTTSHSLASTGSKTVTIQTGKDYVAGMSVTIASAANPSVDYMSGIVTSYSGSTLIVAVDTVNGSGTHTDWSITFAAGAPLGSGHNQSARGDHTSHGSLELMPDQPTATYTNWPTPSQCHIAPDKNIAGGAFIGSKKENHAYIAAGLKRLSTGNWQVKTTHGGGLYTIGDAQHNWFVVPDADVIDEEINPSIDTAMILDAAGNLGIGLGGSTPPTERLDVGGNVRCSGFKILPNAFTNTGMTVSNQSLVNNRAVISFYPTTGPDVCPTIFIVPKGTGLNAANKAQLSIFNTDYVADAVNYEALIIKSAGTKYEIQASNAGTGSARPITISTSSAQTCTFTSNNGIHVGNYIQGSTTDPGAGNLFVTGNVTAATFTGDGSGLTGVGGGLTFSYITGNTTAAAGNYYYFRSQSAAATLTIPNGSAWGNQIKVGVSLDSLYNLALSGTLAARITTVLTPGSEITLAWNTFGQWEAATDPIVKSLIIPQVSGTDNAGKLINQATTSSLSYFLGQTTTGTNTSASLGVCPKGTGLSTANRSQLIVFGTDYTADSTNHEHIAIRSTNTSFDIRSGTGGSGTLRPIKVMMNAVNVFTFNTDSTYQVVIDAIAAPASATAAGVAGTVIIRNDYIYVCTATNTWKRTALSTW